MIAITQALVESKNILTLVNKKAFVPMGSEHDENKIAELGNSFKRTILEHGKFLTVESHTVKLPDGEIIPDWAWIIIPGAAIVLAVTEDNKFLCFRQTKHAVEGTSLEPVGGIFKNRGQSICV